ncbi:AAEL007800-PA [Aedes aegypti]|uniref:AAEL007800-PA n=2 Tax=Aedes aegypti TaxID=7159 RepID=Q170S8_AEDAE|nr:AAEL007800-PA [Aedes aegypti]
MAESIVPPEPKKPKLSDEYCLATIKSILPDDFTQPVQLVDVYVGQIDDTRNISKLIPELNRCLKVPGLQHLKRVGRDGTIILAEASELEQLLKREGYLDSKDNSLSSGDIQIGIAKYFQHNNVNDSLVKSCYTTVAVKKVARFQPKLKWQYDDANKHWPCKFHPNKYSENLYANTVFSDNEKTFHTQIMSACLFLARQFANNPVGICVNPKLKRIVAVGMGKSNEHPMMHCPMVLIDNVAVSQNGGIWHTSHEHSTADSEPDFILGGIDPEYMPLLKDNFNNLKFGAQPIKPVESISLDDISPHEDNLTKYGPYLCTGYDVYLTHEPCIMCAMALTHSRVRRVFYHFNTAKGGLGSITKVHCAKGLNHHYEVFQIV